jgi:hypothetical protein
MSAWAETGCRFRHMDNYDEKMKIQETMEKKLTQTKKKTKEYIHID